MRIALLATLLSAQSLLYSPFAQAQPTVSKDLLWKRDSAQQLLQDALAFREWNLRFVPNLPEVIAGENNLDLLPYASPFVSTHQGVTPLLPGPNCWNVTLKLTGILDSLTYTAPEEMTFWLTSPLCRQLPASEPALPGDVIAVRNEDGSEKHGFIHISANLSYSKNGYEEDRPYGIQATADVFKFYEVKPDCQRQYTVGCGRWANYYRCEGTREYLKNSGLPVQPEIAIAQSLLSKQEELLSRALFKTGLGGLDTKAIESAILIPWRLADEAITAITLQKQLSSQEEQDLLLWTGLAHRAKSLTDQLWVMKLKTAPSSP